MSCDWWSHTILVSDWSRRLLGVISLSLGQERGHLDTLHTGMVTSGEGDTVDNCTTLRYDKIFL